MSMRNPAAEVQEVVPHSIMYDGASQNSLVMNQHLTQAVPISGGTDYAPNGSRDIVFRMQSEHMLDFADLALMFHFKTEQKYIIPDDLLYSVIERIQVRVNDVPVDDITDVSTLVRTQIYLTSPKQYYQGQLHSMSGAVKYYPSNRNVTSKGTAGSARTGNGYTMQPHDAPIFVAENAHHHADELNPRNIYCLPLNFLSLSRGYANDVKLWPAKFTGSIELIITLADWQKACVIMSTGQPTADNTFSAGAGHTVHHALPGNPNAYSATYGYQVSKPKLLYRTVEMHPEYYSRLMDLIMKPEQAGLTIYHNSFSCISKQIVGSVSGTHDISISIARRDLRALYVLFKPKFTNREFHLKSSAMFGDLFRKAYLTVGSKTVPSMHINNTMEAYYSLQEALQQLNITTAGSCIDYDDYRCQSRRMATLSDPASAATVGREHLERVGHRTTSVLDPFSEPSAYFVLGFNLTKDHVSEANEALGVDTLTTSGQVLTLHVEFNDRSSTIINQMSYEFAAGGADALFIADSTRSLLVQGGAVTLQQ